MNGIIAGGGWSESRGSDESSANGEGWSNSPFTGLWLHMSCSTTWQCYQLALLLTALPGIYASIHMNAQFPSPPSKRNPHGQHQHPVVRGAHGQREAMNYRGFGVGHEQSRRRFSPEIGTYVPFSQPGPRGHHPLHGWERLLLGEDRRTQSASGRNTHRARIGRI